MECHVRLARISAGEDVLGLGRDSFLLGGFVVPLLNSSQRPF
jgi:hypothetical protein